MDGARTSTCILALCFCALHARSLQWLGCAFSDVESAASVLALAAALGFSWTRDHAWQSRMQLRVAPCAVMLGASVARAFFHASTVRAGFTLLALAGFAGLFLSSEIWKKSMTVMVAASVVLPMGSHAEAYLGFPARVLAAKGASALLGALHIQSIQAESVLVLEGGISNVESGCSGLKSLWCGALVVMGAAMVRRSRIDARLLLSMLILVVILLIGNTMRVTILVLLVDVLHAPALAQLVHVPMGALAFLAASALALIALPPAEPLSPAAHDNGAPPSTPAILLLSAALLALMCVTSAPSQAETPALQPLQWPAQMNTNGMTLSDAEDGLFRRHQTASASKIAFDWQGIRGSALVVVSDSFRAHHPPELCLVGAGHRLGAERLVSTDGHAWKRMDLDGNTRVALSWFQSENLIRAELLDRVLADFFTSDHRWALVTVLVEGASKVTPQQLQALQILVENTVHQQLTLHAGSNP